MGLFKTVFGGMKDRMKAVDNLTNAINNGDLFVDRKNIEIKKIDKKETENIEKDEDYALITEFGGPVVIKGKATNVDGVYDKDPNKFADAVKYDTLTHSEVLAKGLNVMDAAAASLCRDNNIAILVFNLDDPQNIVRALKGENIGTVVKE